MEYWYTLYTKPNAEYQVEAALQQRGIETYLPETESPRPRKGRPSKPFFPCYLFMKVDMQRVGLSQVQWTPGLRRIVAFDERPAALADDVIDLIRGRLQGGGWSAQRFQPGDKVRITEGPLKGLLAIFDRPSTPGERVEVLLTFLGQVSRASVAAVDLERAPAEAQVPQPRPPRRTRGRGRRIAGAEMRHLAPCSLGAGGQAREISN
jgi:transcriptional antiterminator RfaH